MKKLFALLAATLLWATMAKAQTADSVDVLDYDLAIDLSNGRPFTGDATLTLQLLRPCSEIGLDLIGVVDSIWVDGQKLSSPDVLHIATDGIGVGQPFTVRLCYRGYGYVEASGWGGLHFDSRMTYNLGVGFGIDPHVVGRAVFPCRDNFTDKATYTLRLTAKESWSSECSGVLQSRVIGSDGLERSVWRIDQPVCTYLVGISQSAYSRLYDTVAGYPFTAAYTSTQNPAMVEQVFAQLDSVVPMFERCFGPYRWHRIGYIPTERGSMEHVNNIALAYQAMGSMSEAGQSTIAHELGHAWFGNLLTCADEGDMWINEGGASFCSEVAHEANHGRASSNRVYQRDLEKVIRTTHITDGSYLPLHGMPHSRTYGSTTYDKGAMVWHSLRGYVGDSIFYAALHTLFDRCAFSNIDAYALRDSLSLYTGIDLGPFFDFHVFGAGFVDYRAALEREGCAPGTMVVRLRQQGVATDNLARASRIPLTLVGWEGQTCKTVVDLDSSEAVVTLTGLPFDPAFCVLDLDCEISDAATVDLIAAGTTGDYGNDYCHMRLHADNPESAATYYVEHHWGHPDGVDTMAGVSRTLERYWVVNSLQWGNPGMQARFRYVRNGGNYADLDRGHLTLTSTVDSLGLLWRPDHRSPWHLVSRTHTGRNEGFMVYNNLRVGEYAIAVVDTNLLDIEQPQSASPMEARLCPNPTVAGEPVDLLLPEGEYTVTIHDTAGRRLWHRTGCRGTCRIDADLTAGTYLVHIENNFISLQSKLIVL